jgi:2-methylaconitate cis-trans-isomerase PrpF
MGPWAITYPLPKRPRWPLGAVQPLTADGLSATLVLNPTPYLIVGIDPDEAIERDEELEAGRELLARRAGLTCSRTVPKLAAVAPSRSDDAELDYRTRIGKNAGWHQGVASSGLLALATAMLHPETVPSLLVGASGPVVRVDTPVGIRRMTFRCGQHGDLWVRMCLGRVAIGGAV